MAKIGRNDPCSCVNGKKYKHCCCAKEQEADSMAQGGQNAFPGRLNAVSDALAWLLRDEVRRNAVFGGFHETTG